MHQGWKVFSKRGGGRWQKYRNQLAVIVSGDKFPTLYMSDALLEHLKRPTHITLLTRGSNVALAAGTDGYKVGRLEGSMAYISATKFIREMNLRRGAYVCHAEAGELMVFDSADTPSLT